MSIEADFSRIAKSLEELVVLATADFDRRPPSIEVPIGETLFAGLAKEAETPAAAPVLGDGQEEPASTTTATKGTTVTIDAVRESIRVFLKGFKGDEGFTAAKAILADFGAESATTLDPKHFDAFMARITA